MSPRRSALQTAIPWLRLARPADTLLATLGTVVGARLAGLGSDSAALVASMTVATAALSAGSMMFNDWHDVAEDRINQPLRPVSSGALSRRCALASGLGMLALGIATSAALGAVWGALAATVASASISYTLLLKRLPFAGNTLVAALSTYPLWCWMPVAQRAGATYWLLLAGCFVFGIARELVNTARDVRGDSAVGLRTAATWLGVPFVGSLAALLMVLAGVLVWMPVFAREAGALYVALLLLATAMLAHLIRVVIGRRTQAWLATRELSRVTRALMLTMIMAYAAAAW